MEETRFADTIMESLAAAVGRPTNSMGIRAEVVGQATNNGGRGAGAFIVRSLVSASHEGLKSHQIRIRYAPDPFQRIAYH
jgi:hypothetical protein